MKHDGHVTRKSDFVRYDAATFYDTVTVAGASFAHDERSVLTSMDKTGIFNAYSLPIGKGEAAQLTRSDKESIFALSYFPKDNRFLFTADRGGDERSHIHVKNLDGSETDLTPGDKLKAGFVGWRSDDAAFFITTTERDGRSFDLYRYATDGYQRELLFKNEGGFIVADVSPDGNWVALSKTVGNTDSDIYLWNVKSGGQPELITQDKSVAQNRVHTFTPDSAGLVYTTDAHSEFHQAWKYDLASGARTILHKADWDVVWVSYSHKGTYRLVATNEDARTVVRILNNQTGQDITLPDLPAGEIAGTGFSRSENLAAMYISRDRASRDLYVLDMRASTIKRMTDTMNPAINTENLVDGQVIRYKSFDNLDIPAILYRPRQASSDARVPALVWVHGGPGGQSRLGYRAMLQHLVNQGYAILAVNNRGSSGYGKTFFHMDDRKHGEVDLDDCVWGHKYLAGLPWVDKDKIGIIGGSYGGYMVAAALAFRPQVFTVGVDIFGVTNWVRTLESIPPWWAAFAQRLYDELGDPKTDKERLRRISPLFHADKIVKPLMVIQGANDPRVIKAESDDIVAAVKKNGVPVDYLVFTDEGHGFRKKKNRIRASESILRFLDTHLRAAGQ